MDWTLTLALATAIVAFCTLLDWLISRSEEDSAKAHLVAWFIQLDDYHLRSAIAACHKRFNQLFRRIYGARVRSWRFFLASAASSYFAVALVAIFFLSMGQFGEWGIANDVFQAMIGMSLLVNVWVDIASLAATRWILRRIEGASVATVLAFLLLDILFSGLLYLVPFYLLLSLTEGTFVPRGEVLRGIFSWSNSAESHIQVMFFSTFFTSALFYLTIIVMLLAWILGLARSRLMVVIEKLESSNHLFKSIGALLAAVVGLIKSVQELLPG